MNSKHKKILLSFDTEEFDLPREHGVDIELSEALAVSRQGTSFILDILKEEGVRATFFCTTNFAEHSQYAMGRIVGEGHEVASHGCDHTDPKPEDLAKSKPILEAIAGKEVVGYRQPRMFPVDNEELQRLGYRYNSSLHPAYIPGRYDHRKEPRLPFYTDTLLQIPASVTPRHRLPVFWLGMHNYPFWLYKKMCRRIVEHDGLFVIYYHPWEFTDLKKHPYYNIPFIIKRNAGEEMRRRLRELIRMFKEMGAEFVTYSEFTDSFSKKE